MVTVAVAAQALAADAERWTGVSEALGDAASAVGGLTVASGDFPSRGSVDTLYPSLMEKVTGLLISGRNEAKEVSDELLHVKRVITSADERAKESIEQFWDYTF
jgi:hypothetical protein